MSRLLVGTNGYENFVVSPDSKDIFVAGNDGYVREYSSSTGSLLNKWLVGNNLGGIAISHDGTQLVITEQTPVSTSQSNMWTSNVTVDAVYQVDVASGYVQTYQYTATGSNYTFAGVSFTDDNTVILSENILPGWSGWAPLVKLDLNTVTFSAFGNFYSGLGSAPSLVQSATGTNILVGQLGLSSADYFLINSSGTTIANTTDYQNGVMGYANEIEAFVGSGSTGRIAIVTGGGLHLYDGAFHYIANLATSYPDLGYSAGITFNADGSILYAIDTKTNEIDGIALENGIIVQHIAIGGSYTFSTLKWGSELTLLNDGHTFLLSTTSGIVEVDAPTTNIPTDHADKLNGTAQDDVIAGLKGADIIHGWGGNDTIYGDGGADKLNGDNGNDILFGGAGTDELRGGSGNDILVGGTGKDVLYGGKGADSFYFVAGDTGKTRVTADVIADFNHAEHDIIDLSAIDTNVSRGGLQPFKFIGDAAFSASGQQIAGELHYVHADGMTYVEGDMNGDGKADLVIALKGTIDLVASDFLL
ncbi:calcium-binding protein [Novosphingobium nitrogenifigens]|uniref:calcium-binding protein n=1 Tax=Novosphingobium nitrogenifigens TaxID=378548 RepID=UPI000A4D172C|nr:RTX toxin [Novosphingobium nitrogenifigens]